ncbi:hypothetical protein CEXT_103191 [Caerostris extrusa]|uniref:Uncharacterized protein n=1 Tax=Caerostris extrusa TaxID=172846 RepID=A0AAV4X2V6_CAEEX|nr:hypothetical protein CEXT_103191 [Caerostris extrusa]
MSTNNEQGGTETLSQANLPQASETDPSPSNGHVSMMKIVPNLPLLATIQWYKVKPGMRVHRTVVDDIMDEPVPTFLQTIQWQGALWKIH